MTLLKFVVSSEILDVVIINPRNGEETLFLSSRGTRMSVRTVELMIKDKVLAYLPDMKNKHKISPHKLRSTAATRLLPQTDDILLVSK